MWNTTRPNLASGGISAVLGYLFLLCPETPAIFWLGVSSHRIKGFIDIPKHLDRVTVWIRSGCSRAVTGYAQGALFPSILNINTVALV
ncbi:hypothetical protein F4775DRAFT_81357 [Biscogniauxia sp. FL1348]|nr:hypothetical protein F4775DRAFT_81357 [Biscogniauxia sp. FL1348]